MAPTSVFRDDTAIDLHSIRISRASSVGANHFQLLHRGIFKSKKIFSTNCVRALVITSLILVLVTIPNFRTYAAEIGLYFDTAGACNCQPNRLYSTTKLYIVLKDTMLTSVGGIEGSMVVDPGVLISMNDIPNGGFNVATFPDMVIGYHIPIPFVNNTAVLASFDVYALAAGGLGMVAYDPPSVPGAEHPIVSNYNGSILIETTLSMPGNPLAIIGYKSCGDYEFFQVDDVPADDEVWLSLNDPLVPTYHAEFPHGSGTNSFGFEEITDAGPAGIRDFDVFPNGEVAILDTFNERVVVLNSDLTWNREIETKGRAVRIGVYNELYIQYSTGMVGVLEDLGFRRMQEKESPIQLDRPYSRDVFPITYRGVLDTQGFLHASFTSDERGNDAPLFSWNIHLPQEVAGTSLAVNDLIGGNVYYTTYYRILGAIESYLYVIGFNKSVNKCIALPPAESTCLQPRTQIRVGASGDIVVVTVGEESTEVFKW